MKRFLLPLVCLLFVFNISPALAGPPLTIGGSLQNSIDGVSFDDVTWKIANVSSSEVNSLPMALSDDNWFGEAGHFFTGLQVGDDLIVLAQKEVGAGLEQKGYYAIMSQPLNGADPQLFNELVIQEVPIPTVEVTPEGVLISYTIEEENIPVVGNNILGSNVYGSLDGVTFSQLNSELITDATFLHTIPSESRYYAVALEFRVLAQSLLSMAVRRPYIKGDLDDNGTLELTDAILGLQALTGVPVEIALEATISSDKLTIEDIVNLLQKF